MEAIEEIGHYLAYGGPKQSFTRMFSCIILQGKPKFTNPKLGQIL